MKLARRNSKFSIDVMILLGLGFSAYAQITPSSLLYPYPPPTAFASAVNKLVPILPTWGPSGAAPFPTNSWFTSLGLGLKTSIAWVSPFPYSVAVALGTLPGHAVSQGLDINYATPDMVISSPLAQFVGVRATWGLKAAESVTYHLLYYSQLVTTVRWTAITGNASMTSPIARGSPYLTMIYSDLTPVISSESVINFQPGKITGTRFLFSTAAGQQWLVYTSVPITFTVMPNRLDLVATAPFTGVIRTAYVPYGVSPSQLDSYANTYVVAATVTPDLAAHGFVFRFQTASASLFPGSTNQLLMLALPHHFKLMLNSSRAGMDAAWPTGSRGSMTGVLGTTWVLNVPAPTVGFDPQHSLDADKYKTVVSSLTTDIANAVVTSPNVYSAGTQLFSLARLITIADALGQSNIAACGRGKLKDAIQPWLAGTNSGNNFRYDTTFGGLVTSDGLIGPYMEFGGGFYNDHILQYGYYLYALAVIAKQDSSFITANFKAISSIVRDVTTMSSTDPYFPQARSFDMFESHSWASGLSVEQSGKNIESSSEAINGYYGAYLLGMATGDCILQKWAGLLMQSEIIGTQEYKQMDQSRSFQDTVWSGAVAVNRQIGILWETKGDIQTYFGTNPEYVYAINWLPFTPITPIYLPQKYMQQAWPLAAVGLANAATEGWLGFLIQAQAIYDKPNAWIQAMKHFSPGMILVGSYSTGLTATEVLYFVGTQANNL